MPTEGSTIAFEYKTKVPRRYYEGNKEMCSLSTTSTRRRNDGLTTPYDGYTALCYDYYAF